MLRNGARRGADEAARKDITFAGHILPADICALTTEGLMYAFIIYRQIKNRVEKKVELKVNKTLVMSSRLKCARVGLGHEALATVCGEFIFHRGGGE